MSSSSGAVSFTVRRPSPVSRGDSDSEAFKVPSLPQRLGLTGSGTSTPGSPLSRGGSPGARPKPSARTFEQRDSSDEEDESAEELITGFDQFGVQRLNGKKVPQGPLVIAPLANRDWRAVARARRGGTTTEERFIPGAGAARTGADGSVGGLGTRDSINSGPQLSGLQMLKRQKREDAPMAIDNDPDQTPTELTETDDQRALRLLLSGADGEPTDELAPIIPQLTRTLSEVEVLQQDVAVLPEQASLDDYERVPIAQFGAAMLRGMGWSEGKAANKSGKPDVELWLPERRSALLGIGAKEREVLDDGDPRKKKPGKANMKYMPLVKKEKEGASRDGDDRSSTRDRDDQDRRRDGDRDRDRQRDTSDRDRQRKDEYRDRDRNREYDARQSSRRDKGDYDDSRRERDRDSDRRRDEDRSERRRDDRDRDGRRERDRNDYHRR